MVFQIIGAAVGVAAGAGIGYGLSTWIRSKKQKAGDPAG